MIVQMAFSERLCFAKFASHTSPSYYLNVDVNYNISHLSIILLFFVNSILWKLIFNKFLLWIILAISSAIVWRRILSRQNYNFPTSYDDFCTEVWALPPKLKDKTMDKILLIPLIKSSSRLQIKLLYLPQLTFVPTMTSVSSKSKTKKKKTPAVNREDRIDMYLTQAKERQKARSEARKLFFFYVRLELKQNVNKNWIP